MTTTEIAVEHGVSRQSIHTYRRTGVFPQPVEGQGSTRVRFREDEVAAFFAANPKQPGKKRSSPPQQGESVTTTTDTRSALYAFAMQGKEHSPDNSEKASAVIDAYRASVLREVADEIEGIDAHPNASGRHTDVYNALAHRFRRQADTIDEEAGA